MFLYECQIGNLSFDVWKQGIMDIQTGCIFWTPRLQMSILDNINEDSIQKAIKADVAAVPS